MKFSKLFRVGMSFLTKPYYRTRVLIKSGYYDSLSDEDFLKKVFPKYMGYPLDLENPKTFSEKLQWLKVNFRDPIQTVMVDKHEAKHLIAQRVGNQYISTAYKCGNMVFLSGQLGLDPVSGELPASKEAESPSPIYPVWKSALSPS